MICEKGEGEIARIDACIRDQDDYILFITRFNFLSTVIITLIILSEVIGNCCDFYFLNIASTEMIVKTTVAHACHDDVAMTLCDLLSLYLGKLPMQLAEGGDHDKIEHNVHAAVTSSAYDESNSF